MAKVYVGDVGTEIHVDVGVPLSDVIETKLLVKKPDGREEEWDASVEDAAGGRLLHVVSAGELDVAGDYKIQAYVRFADGGEFRGETAILTVFAKWR